MNNYFLPPFDQQEAKQLSSLHDVMAAHGVGLHAVVHETLGAEEFKSFIEGDVYYDPEVVYRKNPKISGTRKFAVITLKVEQDGFSLE